MLDLSSSGQNASVSGTGESADLFRLTVRTTNKLLRPKAGQYFFLWTPVSIKPWENHPFTLASWEKSSDGTTLHFLIRAGKGATRNIQKKLQKSPNGLVNMRILLEGPYGESHSLQGFNQVLLVAGGSGITAVLPYLFTICADPSNTTRVTLIWCVKRSAFADDVLRHELSAYLRGKDSNVAIVLYITEEDAAPSNYIMASEQSSTEAITPGLESPMKEKSLESAPSGILATRQGRPAMRDVLRGGLDRLDHGERLAVISCGAQGMMDDMRAAVVASYGYGQGQISGDRLKYFEEHFYW